MSWPSSWLSEGPTPNGGSKAKKSAISTQTAGERESREANFLFIRLQHPDLRARDLARRLLTQGIAIHVCDNYEGLDGRFFRVAARTEEENQVLTEALAWALSGKPERKHQRRKTRPLCLREPVPLPARAS